MKFQIISDAHMQVDHGFGNEYGKFDFPVVAPNLALLGGMGCVCDQELFDFIILQLTRFERVFYVMGKDEFHGSTYDEARQLMQAFTEQLAENPPTKTADGAPIAKLGSFHYLHRKRVDIEDVTILGCTLWLGKTERSGDARAHTRSFRPIKNFYAEEEAQERRDDLLCLESQLEACANGEPLVQEASNDANTTSDQTPTSAESVQEEEGDIYEEDGDRTPKATHSELPAEEPSTGGSKLDERMTSKSGQSRQSPARRVVVFTSYPPTHEKTTHPSWVPLHVSDETVETLLRNRQCWAPEGGTGNGVAVDSPIHGNGTNKSSTGAESKEEPKQELDQMDVDTASAKTSVCVHDSGDPLRPPGIAAWAFGFTNWSCDVQYDGGATLGSDLKVKRKADGTPSTAEQCLSCPSCKRIPAPIRMVSNQRGQQWERNPVIYVDVPAGWRCFDEAFVIDV